MKTLISASVLILTVGSLLAFQAGAADPVKSNVPGVVVGGAPDEAPLSPTVPDDLAVELLQSIAAERAAAVEAMERRIDQKIQEVLEANAKWKSDQAELLVGYKQRVAALGQRTAKAK